MRDVYGACSWASIWLLAFEGGLRTRAAAEASTEQQSERGEQRCASLRVADLVHDTRCDLLVAMVRDFVRSRRAPPDDGGSRAPWTTDATDGG